MASDDALPAKLMNMNRRNRNLTLGALLTLVPLVFFTTHAVAQSAATSTWLPPAVGGVQISEAGTDGSRVTSSVVGEFTFESAQRYEAKLGDSFEINVRLKVDLTTKALPELVCYDASGKEIPVSSSLVTGPQFSTTEWQEYQRVFPTRPGTASVRARVRASGRGEIGLANLEFRPRRVDAYLTGALISQPHPKSRGGVMLESDQGIINTSLMTQEDRDGDGKWTLVSIDLDNATRPQQKGVDWRTSFEDNPNEIFWSDGAVLKSDSVREDREPSLSRSLHFRMKVHPGPYNVFMNDPGRAVAISLDGKSWKRHQGGSEISLGTFGAESGTIEFWVDACYRDPVSTGPVYFDYVRIYPTPDAPSVDRLLAAALRRPDKLVRTAAENRETGITVSGPQFVEGRNWPVRLGLPVPQGELSSAEQVAVLNSEGTRIPSQNRSMATWPDGSIKWVHLDFMHDFSKTKEGHYTAAYGNQVRSMPSSAAVRIQPTADGLEVDTGAIRFLVSKRHFGVLENVRLASGKVLQKQPIVSEIVEVGGKTWHGLELPIERIQVEQSGPLHAVILLETKLAESGKPSTGFYHRARIHAYAGSQLIEIDYFVANIDSRHADDVGGSMASKVVVKSIALRIQPAEGITAALHEGGLGGSEGALVQEAEVSSRVRDGENSTKVSSRVRGWVALELKGHGAIWAGIEGFPEQFPKAFRWKSGQLEMSLWAEEGGNYDWVEGVGKTHHLALLYGDGRVEPSNGELLAGGPVLAVATPEWYTKSGAFGPQVPSSDSGYPAVEKALASHMKDRVIDKVGLGFENYGDHSSGGYVKGTFLWDNNEYDLPAGCLVHFARSGDRDALRIGLASALHYLDVDTIHYSSQHVDWAGAQHGHSHATFGHHTAEGPNMHHAGYVQGLIWYSYLTGEPIGLLGAKGIADWVLRNAKIQVGAMERALGHPLMTLNDVYEATWDEAYLEGAARLVDQALKWEHPVRSGFLAPITESPAFYSGSPFCGGLLPSALMKFNSWANLPEIDDMLQRVAQWTLTDVWRPPANIQSKGGSPRQQGEALHIASHLRLMSYVFAHTKDPCFLVVPQKSLLAGFGDQPELFGTRTTGLVFNYLPWFLQTLSENGDPQSEPWLEVRAQSDQFTVTKGGAVRICFTVRNDGNRPVMNLRASFRSRLDLKVTAKTPMPEVLIPGQMLELYYEVQAPERINLTCEYNRNAYAHWSALYEREGKWQAAHRAVRIGIE